ncbi:hypothetical protein [Pararhizobium sp.]|uniref:hypothetical protein n=1 Tax=Pararhizobium sp. TaxID=1977563 RepID=UPI00271DCF8A|nr:hypothetical protein [Pararhizobium sp.]MDO9416203.1 hypothetical protein [Pararhizobium sp.]
MNVIPFPQVPHVEIHGFTVTASFITDGHGTRPCSTYVGLFRFFVDVVERDGGRFGMWDGGSYDDAIMTADELSMDFGPVYDLIGDRT